MMPDTRSIVRIGMFRAAKMSITASHVSPAEAETGVASRGVGGDGGVYLVQPARTRLHERSSRYSLDLQLCCEGLVGADPHCNSVV
jgi:hypothetical protein